MIIIIIISIIIIIIITTIRHCMSDLCIVMFPLLTWLLFSIVFSLASKNNSILFNQFFGKFSWLDKHFHFIYVLSSFLRNVES